MSQIHIAFIIGSQKTVKHENKNDTIVLLNSHHVILTSAQKIVLHNISIDVKLCVDLNNQKLK